MQFIIPVYLLVVIAGTTGWVRNIIAVAQSDFTSINGTALLAFQPLPWVQLWGGYHDRYDHRPAASAAAIAAAGIAMGH
jgi:hypothetical protein